jgi:hypothetical protein
MLKKLKACLFLVLFVLLLISSMVQISRVSGSTEWNLQVTNFAGNTVTFTYDQLLAMPMTNISANLYCYGIYKTGGSWSGVSLSFLLQEVGFDSSVNSISFVAADGYNVAIPLALAMQSDTIIAYAKDNSPLSEELRLVLPSQNGNMWIAEITSIAMSPSLAQMPQPIEVTRPFQITLPTNNSAVQPSPQQQPTLPQLTQAQKNDTSTEPISTPANSTQSTSKATIPGGSSSEGFNSGTSTITYGIVLVTILALTMAGYIVHRRQR